MVTNLDSRRIISTFPEVHRFIRSNSILDTKIESRETITTALCDSRCFGELRNTLIINLMRVIPETSAERHLPARNRRAVNFDTVAGAYRWLEYLTFGRLLEQIRFAHIRSLTDRKRALILGDGDGRFLARLTAQNSLLRADAVDSSAKMLSLVRARICAVD